MRYFVAFIVPPVAVAMCKRWSHFAVNLILWLLSIPLMLFMGVGIIVWLICIAHAIAVCRMSSVDKRVDRIVSAVQQSQGARIQ